MKRHGLPCSCRFDEVVEDCVILDNCDIGRRAKVRHAILDKNVRVPEDALILVRPDGYIGLTGGSHSLEPIFDYLREIIGR